MYKSRVSGIKMKSLLFMELVQTESQREVLQATQRMVARLKLLQCPLNMVHSDRGGEFLGRSFRSFLEAIGAKQSTTEADSPASNGRVEAWIHQIKTGVCKRLLEAELPPKCWALAAVHTAETYLRQQLQDVGVPTSPVIPFYTGCHVQERTWNVNSRGGGVWSARVAQGRIMAPSVHVARGYVILVTDQEGQERLLVSTSINTASAESRENVNVELQGVAVPYSPPMPPRRVRGKQSVHIPPKSSGEETAHDNSASQVPSVPFQDAQLRVQEGGEEYVGSMEQLLRSELRAPEASTVTTLRGNDLCKLDRLCNVGSLRMMVGCNPHVSTLENHETPAQSHRVNQKGRLSVEQSESIAGILLTQQELNRFEVGALLMSTFQVGRPNREVDKEAQAPGAYVHGGVFGVTVEARVRPKLVQVCNLLLRRVTERYHYPTWSALRISCDVELSAHVDSHNCPSSRSYVVPLSVFQQGRILVDGVPQEFGDPPCACIHPRVPHSVEPAMGTRLVLVAYTPRHGDRMSMQDKLLLQSLEFPLPSYMTFPNPVTNTILPPSAAVEPARLGDALHTAPKVCSCMHAPLEADNSPSFSLSCQIPLADVSNNQFNPHVQWYLTCAQSPLHCSLEEDSNHLQSQLLMYRKLLRDVAQQCCPKLQSLGGSAMGKTADKGKPKQSQLRSIGSCRMLIEQVRDQSGAESHDTVIKRQASGGSVGSGETSDGLKEEMLGTWLEYVEGETAKLDCWVTKGWDPPLG